MTNTKYRTQTATNKLSIEPGSKLLTQAPFAADILDAGSSSAEFSAAPGTELNTPGTACTDRPQKKHTHTHV